MKKRLFIGIDVGGTKISAGLVLHSGTILLQKKYPTPLNASGVKIVGLITRVVREILSESVLEPQALTGIGIGIPGIVDTERGRIIKTPNLNLSGVMIVRELEKRLRVPVVAGNDVNLGLLGEHWFGAAQGSSNIVGIFPGTGLGGAVIANGALLTGGSYAAAELGHLIIDPNGKRCGCGNRGCLETVASRWAIERDIRKAIQNGRKTIVKKLAGKNLTRIKSRILGQALKKKDPLVTKTMNRVGLALGEACVNIRHAFDPELIVFGGGIIEACGDYLLPLIRKRIATDAFFSKISHCEVLPSRLGDDAVILGAVALVCQARGIGRTTDGMHPAIFLVKGGRAIINNRTYAEDVYIRSDGKVKRRKRKKDTAPQACRKILEEEELKRICKKNPELLIIGTRAKKGITITRAGKALLKRRGIFGKILPFKEAIEHYGTSQKRTAFFLNLSVLSRNRHQR